MLELELALLIIWTKISKSYNRRNRISDKFYEYHNGVLEFAFVIITAIIVVKESKMHVS